MPAEGGDRGQSAPMAGFSSSPMSSPPQARLGVLRITPSHNHDAEPRAATTTAPGRLPPPARRALDAAGTGAAAAAVRLRFLPRRAPLGQVRHGGEQAAEGAGEGCGAEEPARAALCTGLCAGGGGGGGRAAGAGGPGGAAARGAGVAETARLRGAVRCAAAARRRRVHACAGAGSVRRAGPARAQEQPEARHGRAHPGQLGLAAAQGAREELRAGLRHEPRDAVSPPAQRAAHGVARGAARRARLRRPRQGRVHADGRRAARRARRGRAVPARLCECE